MISVSAAGSGIWRGRRLIVTVSGMITTTVGQSVAASAGAMRVISATKIARDESFLMGFLLWNHQFLRARHPRAATAAFNAPSD
jgi:hypothetical protein